MKKPLSNMTAQRFVEIIGALGGTYKPVAVGLGKSTAMVSLYATGTRPIPVDVALRLGELVKQRQEELSRLGHHISGDAVASMILVSNQLRQSRPGRMAKLCRRMKPEDSRVYPAYRLHPAKFDLFGRALTDWYQACVSQRQGASDIRDINAFDRELADLKVLIGNWAGRRDKGVPYDFYITFSEWFVVSRALRHQTNDAKYALYQHWRHHKGPGFPRVRSVDAQTQP